MTAPARSITADKKFYGVYPAIVSEIGDKDHPGEVRLTFPWFDPGMKTEWCRVCNLYAGNGYGSFFHPEKDDEVLVAFVQGDMRWPIVLGGLYNGQDNPPTARTADKDQKLLRTKGGHEILMDDTSSEKHVQVKTNGGHTADFNDQDRKVEIKTAAGHTVTLDDGGSKITVQTSGGQSITLESGSIKLTATSVVIDAASIKLGGNAAVQSLVLGEAFMALYNSHTHICTAPTLPSAPPLPPMTPAVLSSTNKTS